MSSPNVPQAKAEFQWVPSLAVSERYDTNVFFIDEDRVPGRDLTDVVTTVSPSIAIPMTRQNLQGTARVGANVNYYANNPELNFIGVNGLLDLQLDAWAGRLVRGLQLSVVENVSYTPEPPAFFRADEEARLADPARIGIQAARADTLRHSVSVQSSYPLSPVTGLQASYRNTIVSFGSPDVPEGQQSLLDTTTHAGRLGVSTRTQRGRIGLNLDGAVQESGVTSFETAGATLAYERALTPTLGWTFSGGAVLVNPTEEAELSPLGSASLTWKGPRSNAALGYSRRVVPSITVQAGSLISDNIGGSFNYVLTERMHVGVSANYARNDRIAGDASILFQSVGTSVSLTRQLTRWLALSLSHQYTNFEIEQNERLTSAFDRHVAMLSLTATWN